MYRRIFNTQEVLIKQNIDSKTLTKYTITIISQSSDHSRIAALTCINMIVNEIEKHHVKTAFYGIVTED